MTEDEQRQRKYELMKRLQAVIREEYSHDTPDGLANEIVVCALLDLVAMITARARHRRRASNPRDHQSISGHGCISPGALSSRTIPTG